MNRRAAARRRAAALLAPSLLLLCWSEARATAAKGARRPVVIVGAGMAGAKLAHDLHSRNISFVLVEATNKVGGRLRHARLGRSGPKLELGANWLQGFSRRDRFSTLAADVVGVRSIPDDVDDYYFARNGSLVPDEEADPVWERMQRALDGAYALRRSYAVGKNGKEKDDISVLAAMHLATGWVANTPIEYAAQQAEIDFEYAMRAALLSIHELSPFYDPEEPPSAQRFVSDKDGFRKLVVWHLRRARVGSLVRSGRKLRLRSPVQRIVYNDNDARVELRDGRVIRGSAVVSTVPLGVLKLAIEDDPKNPARLRFSPPMPFRKRLAIAKLSMSTYLKLFVQFRTPVMRTSDPLYVTPLSCREDAFVSLQNLNKPGYLPGKNIVLFTAIGVLGRQLDCASRDALLDEVLNSISEFAGRKVRKWEVTNILKSPFQDNEFFNGMYSTRPVGVTQNDLFHFNRPLGALFFAGEAHHDFSGFVQSAYYSGENAAKEVEQFLLQRDSGRS